ncbi:MAG: hypothetical protein ABL986_22545 [Vicinamibacterales bacterium]
MSLRTKSGDVVEMVFRPQEGKTRLVTSRDGQVEEHDRLLLNGREYVAYSAENNLLTHRVLLLPSSADSYASDVSLLDEIRSFIHRHVDLSRSFEEIVAHYVLLTWVYDQFNELPYLRVRGDYGSGKSRFLLTVGSLCWKPIFASGASTVSPLFRLIDQVGGTLIVDEADFWASDERTEIVKILNNGNARGFPVLRSEVSPSKEFSPRAFNIYGPKVVATRHPFEDEALESRCLTEVLGTRPLRKDIPISLPKSFEGEADALRNKLLRYRFAHLDMELSEASMNDSGLEPRRMQILRPLLQVAVSKSAKAVMREFFSSDSNFSHNRDRAISRQVLSAVSELMRNPSAQLTIGAIAERLKTTSAVHSLGEVSHRWVGSVLRRLGLEPQKSNGVYKIAVSDFGRITELLEQYGVGDFGDIGDVDR